MDMSSDGTMFCRGENSIMILSLELVVGKKSTLNSLPTWSLSLERLKAVT